MRAPRGPFPAGRGEDGEGGNEGGDEGAAAHGGATAAGRGALKRKGIVILCEQCLYSMNRVITHTIVQPNFIKHLNHCPPFPRDHC